MSSIAFYFDTHIPKAVALQLRACGILVVRAEEVALATVSDVEHLRYAASNGFTLVTQDFDFVQLHIDWQVSEQTHAGIILFNQRFQGDVGKFVRELTDWHSLIEMNAGTLEADVYNQLIQVTS